jgi:DUF2934 family protein
MKTTMERPRQDEIAHLARQIWEWEGRQSGRDMEYWLRAERQLLTRRNEEARASADSGASPTGSARGSGRPIRLPESIAGSSVR